MEPLSFDYQGDHTGPRLFVGPSLLLIQEQQEQTRKNCAVDDNPQISDEEAQLKMNNKNFASDFVILFEVSTQESLSLMNIYI